ncbi:hypothetical protein, partial [uncultured Nostoc sp.]
PLCPSAPLHFKLVRNAGLRVSPFGKVYFKGRFEAGKFIMTILGIKLSSDRTKSVQVPWKTLLPAHNIITHSKEK